MKYVKTLTGVLGAACLVLASAAISAESEPIRIGAMTSTTGPVPISESIDGLKAYLETINQSGGVQGRKIQLIWVDDGGDPAKAKELGKRLVETERVVALVGGASVVECATNADYYLQSGLVAIPGTGVEDKCFSSPAIAPVNAGPFTSLGTALKFASDILNSQKICFSGAFFNIKGMEAAYRERVEAWSKASGKKLLGASIPFDPSGPPTGLLKEVEQRGCETVVFVALEKSVLDILTAQASENVRNMNWIFMTPAYTSNVAKAGGKGWRSIYAMSEFMPWTSADLAVRDWKEQLRLKRVPLSSFSQGGYVSGQVLVEALRRIKGDITRDSVRRQFLQGEKIDIGMMGSPFIYGTAQPHNPNHQTIPVRLMESAWRVAHYNWISVD